MKSLRNSGRRDCFCLFCSTALLLLQTGLLFAAPPELSRLFPTGGQIGSVVDIEATGKFPDWPVQIWCSSNQVDWSCQKDAGKLQVKIAEGATPGLVWMRMHHPRGASALRPFLLGEFPERNELEPNDRAKEANEIPTLPHSVEGALDKRGDRDCFSFSLKANEMVAATIDSAKWLTTPADINLQVLDQQGNVLVENIDHVGLDPYVEFKAARDGTYMVRVFAFPTTPDTSIGFSGGTDWLYRLRLGRTSMAYDSTVDYSHQHHLASEAIEVPLAQHVAFETAMPCRLPCTVQGRISQRKETNYVRFTAKSGNHYHFQLMAREFGSPLDATLSVLDLQGKALAHQDDADINRDPNIKWKAPSDGEYVIAISDFHRQGSDEHRYRLMLQERTVDFTMTAANDVTHSTIGKETEIAIAIARESEFVETIQISLLGLPASVHCAMEESKSGTDSAGKVTLKLIGNEAYQGPMRIIARTEKTGDRIFDATGPNNKPLWLSITAE